MGRVERGGSRWQGSALAAETAGKKRQHFVRLEALHWAQGLPELRGAAFWLLRVIAERADPYGCCWLSRKRLARAAGISLRSVSDGLNALERRGLIRRIGRVGRDGGRISSVLQLVAWPGRKTIPPTGHPILGPTVREPPANRRPPPGQGLPRGGQGVLEGGARAALQKKEREKGNWKRRLHAEKRRQIIESALLALGPWATAENWSRLEDDTRRLIGWVERGISLERVILPVLEEMAQGPVPCLANWGHFEAAILARAGKDGHAR
ncbi:Helix-turn-helix domain-containing protein [Meinhardsimonia xiamenensis]|uniref:Helix-turn-helix domain-containing protein n=1 Tax=Meinhardsimonia xiamenensis TaxID=990712 RepID=A0A1G9HK53_9RHOB|nr:helix-turn-helix domain-containing protein [Meinhardsimonia xiamenensis]PRX27673.1 Helix-turn-helix domain-containing protein [Meinhardsimonia xiamenensis]SDL13265.1 Helix-turn-helix domain-containing protein [Meinhardsimonia xiamenensis]